MEVQKQSSTTSKLGEKLKDPEYRKAFVASQINIGIPFQIRALLKSHPDWTQETLARRTQMLQPRISALMTPGKTRPNIETLRRIAAAFDCGLMIRFAPFSELARWSEKFDPEAFTVASFQDDIGFKEQTNEALNQITAAKELTGAQQGLTTASAGDDLSWLGNSQEAANRAIAAYAKQGRMDYLEPASQDQLGLTPSTVKIARLEVSKSGQAAREVTPDPKLTEYKSEIPSVVGGASPSTPFLGTSSTATNIATWKRRQGRSKQGRNRRSVLRTPDRGARYAG